jgi:catechol 2,3-dioxygenase-like lactoylglutathione lyase family enzyme
MTTREQAATTRRLIEGGNATIYVSDMDRAVRFYTETLGLTILYRAGDHFAMVDAGRGLQLGLHPAGPASPRPGARGSISVGLTVTAPIEQVVTTLKARGVQFHGPIKDDSAVRLAFFGDPDGNDLYLCQA